MIKWALLLSIIYYDGEIVKWSERKLKFSDFKQVNNVSQAVSYFDIDIITKHDADSLYYYIEAVFQCDSAKFPSFISGQQEDADILLAHEQGHFDIAEICSRKLKKHLAENIRKIPSNDLQDFIQNSYENMVDSESRLDSLYDRETVHGILNEESGVWKKKINLMLDSLKEYQSPRGAIALKPQ